MSTRTSAMHPQLSPEKAATTAATAAKKRNPYSIEELLKKPEKRIRLIEPISFHPPILIHNINDSHLTRDQSKSPELHVNVDDDEDNDEDVTRNGNIDNNNKRGISIEVCD